MSVSNVFVLFHSLLLKAKLVSSALSVGLDSLHINVSFSMGSIAYCGVMKTPSCIILLTQGYYHWGAHLKCHEEVVFLAYETTTLHT